MTDFFGEFADKLAATARQRTYLNYEPNPLQESFHRDKRRKKLFIGGNRAGKTTAGLNEVVGWVSKRHKWREEIRNFPDPIRARIICKDLNNSFKEVVLPGVRRWLPLSDLKNGSWEDSYSAADRMLTLANKSTISFKTYDQDPLSHAGVSLHCIHFDEPPPKTIYDENLLRLLDTYGDFEGSGAYWMTYTPVGGMDWAYHKIYKPGLEDPDSGIMVIHSSVDDNKYVEEEAKKDLFHGLTQNEIDIRRHGKYIQLSGMVFDEWGSEHVILPDELVELGFDERMLPPRSWKIYWSIDHGLHNPTAIYWHAVNDKTDEIITFHERYVTNVIVEDHAKYVKAFEKYMGREPDYRTGDPAMSQRSGQTGTSILQEYAKHDIFIATESVPKDPSIGIVRMRQYMKKNPATGKPRWRIYDCPFLDKELQDLHWENYVSTKVASDKNLKETVHKYKDHGFDSCKYFFTFMPDLANRFVEPVDEKWPEGSLVAAMAEMGKPPTWNANDPGAGLPIFRPVKMQKTVWHIEDVLYGSDGFDD